MYAKLIDGNLEFAPQNKGAIINYNVNIELMKEDGYKLFIEAERPATNRKYHIEYDENLEEIREIIVFDETQKEADKREAKVREQSFKAKFFEISGIGWYRKQPKGYSSAVESINSAYNSFTEMQKLGLAENFPANTLIFYQQPDFTKPEQCTEEWLVAHQIFNQEMTPEQFGQFYISFIQAWNTQEHE